MNRLELVVFDLAGTLVDDGGAVLAAYRGALNGAGIVFTDEDVQAARGASKRAVFQAFARREFGSGPRAAAAAAHAYDRFDAELRAAYGSGPLAPIEGAEACLARLQAAGLKLATNTGFPLALADIVLDRLGWRPGPFAAQVASDEVAEGRPAPYMIHLAMQRAGVLDAGRVLIVGDTPLDLQAGTHAGAAGVIGVLSGSHGVDTLGRVRHTHLLPSVAALPDLLAAEFGG